MQPYFTSRFGDIFHGDSTKIIAHVLERYRKKHIILLTDPMYGQGANSNTKSSGRYGHGGLKGDAITKDLVRDWDLDDTTPFDPSMWLDMGFDQYIMFGAQNYASRLPDSKKWIIWDKRGNVKSDDNADAEMAWTFNVSGPTRIYRHLWKGRCRSGEENASKQGQKLHTFQKPIALIQFCLKELKIKDISDCLVVDPYSGSFTTGAACERFNIPWIGVEILEEFCEVGKTRIEKEMSSQQLFGYNEL